MSPGETLSDWVSRQASLREFEYCSVQLRFGKTWRQKARVAFKDVDQCSNDVREAIDDGITNAREEEEFVTHVKVTLYKAGGEYVGEKPLKVESPQVISVDGDGTITGEHTAMMRETRLALKDLLQANLEGMRCQQQMSDKLVTLCGKSLETQAVQAGELANARAALMIAEQSSKSEVFQLIETFGPENVTNLVMTAVSGIGGALMAYTEVQKAKVEQMRKDREESK